MSTSMKKYPKKSHLFTNLLSKPLTVLAIIHKLPESTTYRIFTVQMNGQINSRCPYDTGSVCFHRLGGDNIPDYSADVLVLTFVFNKNTYNKPL